MSKLLQVSKSKYRASISEILPYERPVFFTNRYFARFLKHYGIKEENGILVATRNANEEGLQLFLEMIGGKKGAKRPCFQYSITKDGHEKGRRLTIIHPYHQVQMVEFYDRYKPLIIDFCQRSHFSIRFPYKVATYQRRQKGYHKIMSDDAQPVDIHESLKHFFAYRYYKNINFFYDDYRFLRAEKRFRSMEKIDLKHCFENIEPESLSVALFGHSMKECEGTIASNFSQLQHDFLNREKGIVIGPEFSRLYAEMILQRIDKNVEKDLDEKGISRNVDYIFYRYVDDGFFYYNDPKTKVQFLNVYEKRLKEYNQIVNDKKQISFKERPFLESISSVKIQLLRIVDEHFQNRLETFRGYIKSQDKHIDAPMHIDYKKFINDVRSVMRIGNNLVKYKDVTSFLLGIIQKRLLNLLADFNILFSQYSKASESGDINAFGQKMKDMYEREFITYSMEMIEIMFYFLMCDMRMSTSVKVISIINKLQMFVRGRYDICEGVKSVKFSAASVETLDDKISDEISSMLLNTQVNDYNAMEILNVLELEKIMSKKNQIAPEVISKFIDNNPVVLSKLNFFTTFEILHFIKDDKDYDFLRKSLHGWISKKIKSLKNRNKSDTEAVLTFMETMSCPWVDNINKKEFAEVLFGKRSEAICAFARNQKDIFIQWRDFNLNEAIQNVNSSEVY